jgi:hypothetical protein
MDNTVGIHVLYESQGETLQITVENISYLISEKDKAKIFSRNCIFEDSLIIQ